MKKRLTIKCQYKTLQCVFPIIEYDGEPILMVMQDDFSNLFLCLCSDFRAIHRWIVAPTRIEVVRRLINFEITINDALRAVSKFACVVECHGSEYKDHEVAFDSINPLYLAEEGVYADFIEDECDDNLSKLEKEIKEAEQADYLAAFAKMVSESLLTIAVDFSKSKKDNATDLMKSDRAELDIQMQCSFHITEQIGMPSNDDPQSFAA